MTNKQKKKKVRNSRSKAERKRSVSFQSGEVLVVGAASASERLSLVDHMHIKEIDRQCSNALHALRDLDRAVRSGKDKDDELWYAAQALAVAVGSISKTLLGTAARNPRLQVAKERATRLRARLGVRVDAPWLLRHFRDSLEHFDERLDEWGARTNPLSISDRTVVRRNYKIRYFVQSSNLAVPAERWREYNAVTDVLSYQGQELHLGLLRTELPELQARAKKEIAQRPVLAGNVQLTAIVDRLPRGAVATGTLAQPNDPRPVAQLSVRQL